MKFIPCTRVQIPSDISGYTPGTKRAEPAIIDAGIDRQTATQTTLVVFAVLATPAFQKGSQIVCHLEN
jgi:hypothetical protein